LVWLLQERKNRAAAEQKIDFTEYMVVIFLKRQNIQSCRIKKIIEKILKYPHRVQYLSTSLSKFEADKK